MTSEQATRSVNEALSDAVRLTLEALETQSTTFRDLAQKAIQTAKRDHELLLTSREREFTLHQCDFLERYLSLIGGKND